MQTPLDVDLPSGSRHPLKADLPEFRPRWIQTPLDADPWMQTPPGCKLPTVGRMTLVIISPLRMLQIFHNLFEINELYDIRVKFDISTSWLKCQAELVILL